MASHSDEFDGPSIAVHIVKKQNQRLIGACVHRKVHNEIVEETSQHSGRTYAFELELFEFIDNEQYYNLDTLLNQVGNVVLYVSDEFQDVTKGEGRKLHNLFSSKSLDETHIKKSCFTVRPETSFLLSKLVGETTHSVNIAETERPLAFGCLECLMKALRLKDEIRYHGGFNFRLSSLNSFMRLDSAASDAVNLFPKPDHPSLFGSVFGVLNRCKTKMGSRLLERYNCSSDI
jgi:DNA mismatch repair protein MSH2